jgi:proteasome accessory factor PafA2
MATAKVLGIETEYGIAGGPDHDPISASTLIVNAYAQPGRSHVNWDFDDEMPGHDARGFPSLTSLAPIVETHLANTVLANGARFYVDHAHPEYSSPECRTPIEAVLFDVAGEEVLRRAVLAANAVLPSAQAIICYKDNSDGKGNSYGCHENFLVDRHVPFESIVRAMVPHLISRQVVCGAGKVGAETEAGYALAPEFQLSQRAEFFEEVVGLETTLKRPIVNTRDEPHGDPERFRRLHVIIGDANMSQFATLVKLGSTSLLLAVLESRGPDIFPPPPRQPVRALRAYSADPTMTVAYEADDGRSRTAWDYQDELWSLARNFIDSNDTTLVAPESEVEFIMLQWREMLDGVRDDLTSVADRVDWVAKLRLVSGLRERYDLEADHMKLRAIDLQYHDIRPERSLAARCSLRELVSHEEAVRALTTPPPSTRAYFRGRCIEKYSENIAAANWDSVVFDLGVGPLHRVPMMDPLRGTAEMTGDLLDRCATARDLLDQIDT